MILFPTKPDVPKREQVHDKIESNNFLILWFTLNTSQISLQTALICSNKSMSAVHFRKGTQFFHSLK